MSAKRTLLLIRHAETDFVGTFCGHADPPINEQGRLQIERLIPGLKHHTVDAVYSSDLQRALMTAKVIAKSFAASLGVVPDLREIGFGDWESLTWEQIEQRDPIFAQHWVNEFPKLPTPHGEEFDSFEKRTLSEFDAVVASNQNAAIVTHAGVLRVIMTQRCGLSHEQAWLRTKAYCGVFTYSGEVSNYDAG
jgi:broad specificity phosphatase PhoE